MRELYWNYLEYIHTLHSEVRYVGDSLTVVGMRVQGNQWRAQCLEVTGSGVLIKDDWIEEKCGFIFLQK